ncbi:hypothetical protein V6Z12_A01G089300 [Gossypium hirsutum]
MTPVVQNNEADKSEIIDTNSDRLRNPSIGLRAMRSPHDKPNTTFIIEAKTHKRDPCQQQREEAQLDPLQSQATAAVPEARQSPSTTRTTKLGTPLCIKVPHVCNPM